MSENYITCQEENGSINISEEVIYSLVKAAVSEVEGVASLSNTAGSDIAELIGIKNLSKGIKVQFVDGRVVADVIINVVYGCSIVSVAQKVQEAVMDIIRSTTGLNSAEVNVHVSGVAFEK